MLTALGRGIDALVTAFSPAWGLRRRLYRERSATYAAAQTHRLTGDWAPVDSTVNDIIRASNALIRPRIRQLVRDFPYFARAVDAAVDFTVGPGITYQARVRDSSGGALDRALNQRIEDAFHFWADEADAAKKLHYYEIMQLAKRQDMECGEFILVTTDLYDRGRYLPFALQIYEPDWLTTANDTVSVTDAANAVDQGIEYRTATGEVVAYHFTDPDGWGKSVRIPAKRVIHGFRALRPGQLRGVSPLVAAVLMAHDMHDYIDAEIDAAKMAAKRLAVVTSDDPYARQAGLAETDADTGAKIEEMENAIIEYLRPGEDITIATNPRPGDNFGNTVRFLVNMLSVVSGIPYEILSADYRGLNYSTSRTARNDFAVQLRGVAARHVRHFGMPTLNGFLGAAVTYGRLDLPNYFVNPSFYARASWQPPGMESIDPLRETKARISEVTALLRSPQEIIRARGGDPERVLQEIADFKAWADDQGLDFQALIDSVGTGVKNNPAAVAQQRTGRNLKVIRRETQ